MYRDIEIFKLIIKSKHFLIHKKNLDNHFEIKMNDRKKP